MTQAIRNAFNDHGRHLYDPFAIGTGVVGSGAGVALTGMSIPIAAAAAFGAPFIAVGYFTYSSLESYKDSSLMTITKFALSQLAGFAASMLVSVGLSYWSISITISQGAVLALAMFTTLVAFTLAAGLIAAVQESCTGTNP